MKLIRISLTTAWSMNMTLSSWYQSMVHNSIKASNQIVGFTYGSSLISHLINATKFGISFQEALSPVQKLLATLIPSCFLVWLMCLCFSTKVYLSGMPIVKGMLSHFYSSFWSWQIQLQWHNSVALLDTTDKKGADYFVDSSGKTRYKAHIITWHSYSPMALKITECPPTQMLISTIFQSLTQKNINRICFTSFLLCLRMSTSSVSLTGV